MRRRPDGTTAKVVADHRTNPGQQPLGRCRDRLGAHPRSPLRVNLDTAGSIARDGGLHSNARRVALCGPSAGPLRSRLRQPCYLERPVAATPRDRFCSPRVLPRAIAMATFRARRGRVGIVAGRGGLLAAAEVADAAPPTALRPEGPCCATLRRCPDCPGAAAHGGACDLAIMTASRGRRPAQVSGPPGPLGGCSYARSG